MSNLYLSNKGSTVKIKIDNIYMQYLGPKNLVRFDKINKIGNGVLYVDTVFKSADGKEYIEEDYIDIEDLLMEFKYNTQSILKNISKYEIGNVTTDFRSNTIKQGGDRLNKDDIIRESLMVSDNLALLKKIGSTGKLQILIISMYNTRYQALINFEDLGVLQSNMSDTMLKRAVAAVKRNRLIIPEIIRKNIVNA